MTRWILLASLSLAACGRREEIVSYPSVVQIHDPALATAHPESGLHIPASCPTYAPGGGDVDTPEPPFELPLTIACAVDEAGVSYGLAVGDAPTAHLAVIPGNQNLGIYIGVVPGAFIDWENLIASGPTPGSSASFSPTSDFPLSEGLPLTLTTIAAGEHGVLSGLGAFDGAAVQVSLQIGVPFTDGNKAFYGIRFYVNAVPSP